MKMNSKNFYETVPFQDDLSAGFFDAAAMAISFEEKKIDQNQTSLFSATQLVSFLDKSSTKTSDKVQVKSSIKSSDKVQVKNSIKTSPESSTKTSSSVGQILNKVSAQNLHKMASENSNIIPSDSSAMSEKSSKSRSSTSSDAVYSLDELPPLKFSNEPQVSFFPFHLKFFVVKKLFLKIALTIKILYFSDLDF